MRSNSGWSEDLIEETRKVIVEKRFTPINDNVYLKNINGCFGYIAVSDWLSDSINVFDHSTGEMQFYQTFDDFLEDGWAVD